MKRRSGEHRVSLQQAVIELIQAQALLSRESAECRKAITRIERDLDQIKAMLYALPEALKREIGFKTR